MEAVLRAKFQIQSVKQSVDNTGAITQVEIDGHPVYGGEENAVWSKATPSGSLKLYISNPGAFGALVVGKEYYLDFTPAED